MSDDSSTSSGQAYNRKKFLGMTAAAAGTPALISMARAGYARAAGPVPELEEATIAQLQAAMSSGGLTALSLVQKYQARINVLDKGVNSVLELDRKSTRLNSSHIQKSRMPSSA